MAESDGLENRCALVAPWVRIPLPPQVTTSWLSRGGAIPVQVTHRSLRAARIHGTASRIAISRDRERRRRFVLLRQCVP